MDVREKLKRLLIQKGFGVEGATIATDHLIAHGVTVQKWIPVAERLPEEMEWVLCTGVDNEVHILRYDYIMDDWDIHNRPNSCHEKGFVTHWMPLPEPPKERIDETILQQDELLKRRDALKGMKINDEGITGK